ncbi:hypothetical protein DesyoDRAFT_1518 [Desulfosporosinus youngiae DSM 17734]|uniref:Uncharacterized protein n=1 Tax=Desulfosporosinus youngiae DSM 17734 TaxID=768710 RepID=H5Y2H3_9FIRM|nr:hypothetical protein DesyoDRAFT_1518 [Desulfosporosinus youngiae DSM 17734]
MKPKSTNNETIRTEQIPPLNDVIEDLDRTGKKVHLTTTDPSAHLKFVLDESSGITMSHIDEQAELAKYQEEVLAKARETMSEADITYIEEDLQRAGIATKWWLINSSLYRTGTSNQLLSAKAGHEVKWINKVAEHSNGHFAVIA